MLSRRRREPVVSDATKRSSRMRIEKIPLDLTIKKSLVTLERVVSIEH